ncbi:MAG TPA: HD domain-containing protein, partial [Patescibacteria group bacterium]|nr:HD domain-containing protein [Patescibacteria group bacterium]
MSEIVERVRAFVEGECKKPGAKYGPAYEGHFIPMHKYSVELAKKLNADIEIVEIAAWLHDIGSIINGREEHHITGAKIAEQKLKELGYPIERIQRIIACILNHRGSVNNERATLEERIVAEADALSNFDNIGGMFEAACVYEHRHQQDAAKSVLIKLTNKYNQLSQEGKELVKPKYEAA